MNSQSAVRMAAVYAGNTDIHYVADFTNVRREKNGKKVPQYKLMKGAPTIEDFERHLQGKVGLLVVPVMGDRCRWGKIDVDEYPADPARYTKKIAQLGLPLIVELTKSGGLHLAHYRRGYISAAEMRGLLADWAAQLGCSPKVEIFPKQDRLAPGEEGSAINLPYFGGDSATNVAVDETVVEAGVVLTVEQWLDRIERMPAAPTHTPGQVNIEAAADLLAQHWTEGQRDHLNLAAAGAMLRAGVDESDVQAVLDAVHSAGADNEQRRSADSVTRAIESGKRVPGYPKLAEIMGVESARDFMRLVGGKPPPDPLPITFQPFPLDWANEALPPQTYIVERLVPPKCVTLLIAEGGAGKTTFALHAAVAVAGGRPLFGKAVSPGPVCYVGREDNEESLRRRLFTIVNAERERMRREGCAPATIDAFDAALAANFRWAAAVGVQMHFISTVYGQTNQTALIEALIAKLPQPLRLLVLDPLARFHGGEENSNSVATALMDACELFAQRASCAVLMPHHTGKAAAKERDGSQYAARGASALVDSARSAIRLIVATVDETSMFGNVPPEVVAAGDLVTVSHVKNSTGKRDLPFHLRRQELGFELFVPEQDGGKARDAQLLRSLYDWWIGPNERRPFTKKLVKERRSQVFGALAVTVDEASALVEVAIAAEILIPGPKSKHAHVPPLVFREGYDPQPM